MFAEVLEVRPELGPSVAAFAGQHARLMELVRELARLMPDDGVSLAAASMFIPDVVHALREHERSESQLLFAVWQGDDTGNAD